MSQHGSGLGAGHQRATLSVATKPLFISNVLPLSVAPADGRDSPEKDVESVTSRNLRRPEPAGAPRQAQCASITSTPRGTCVCGTVRTGRLQTGQIVPPSPSVQPERSCHPEAPHARSSGVLAPTSPRGPSRSRDPSRTARHARASRSTTTRPPGKVHAVLPREVGGHCLVVRQRPRSVNGPAPQRNRNLPRGGGLADRVAHGRIRHGRWSRRSGCGRRRRH
jgi:hypothetical protein